MICKDGTIVPIYFFDNLFYMPYLVPTSFESDSSGGIAPHYADEDGMFLSAFTCDKAYENDENNVPEEAVVRLATTAIPQNQITINREMSDHVASLPENDELTATHAAFGHVSAKKMNETAAVADGVPKYRDVDTWCTSCSAKFRQNFVEISD